MDVDEEVQLRFALVRAIEIVGEAASKISPETKASLPNIPWTKIVGTRNRLAHAYFSVDHAILWNTATVAIPELLDLLDTVELD
ncbi:MAG: DUF86 domain-containing protein [Rhizobiaceae bacterium]|nr:DUF86 domain-containing protein [Rhizobiaceae bacterium]